ncbi:MAG: hypothetical protein LUF35_11810 [Lachnospiraceae bacterium]|nr:hypothetical protein [Lachnospiraceae bacterium]
MQEKSTTRLNRTILPAFLFLASALLAGSAIPGLLDMGSGSYASLASLYSLQVYERTSLNVRELFVYVATVRMRTLLILWLSSFTTVGLLFHLGYGWWLIASGAMLLSLFGLRSGFDGIKSFACCLFPQWILYGALWKRETAAWLRRQAGHSGSTGFSRRGKTLLPALAEDVFEFLQLAAICLCGCACEAFLGTWTLKLYLQL